MKLQTVALFILLVLFVGSGCSKKCKPGEDTDCWIDALRNPAKINQAIDNLKQIADKKAEPAFIEAMKSQPLKPRQIEQLAKIFHKWKTVNAVKPMLTVIDYTVGSSKESQKTKRINRANQRIASALGAIGDSQAITPLIRLMKTTKEPKVQRAAVRSLGQLKAQDATDDLIRLSADSNANAIVRKNAVFALGEIGNPKAVDSLILSLYRDKAYFFFQAGLALVKIGDPAVGPLVETMYGKNNAASDLVNSNTEGISGALESNAAKVLGDIRSPKASQPLLDMAKIISKWEDKTSKMMVMTRIINALGSIGDPLALDLINSYLSEDLWDVRTVCANAINSISQRSAIEALYKYTDTSKYPQSKKPLIEAMGNLGTDEILPKLNQLLRTQKDPTLNKIIKESIKKAETYKACNENVACWIEKLKDKDAALREKAAYELGRLGNGKAISALIEVIQDSSENVRFAVMWALDKMNAKNAVEPIMNLLASEKGSARYKVANYNYQLLAARLSRLD